ncbi:hypothetical protein [Streptomyces sp. NPDC017941]|uniref:hypothetical protein n=1 Tax=Streptomyces sp. NPDC017941 TaxID=3365018 RepID=UPI0037946BE1
MLAGGGECQEEGEGDPPLAGAGRLDRVEVGWVERVEQQSPPGSGRRLILLAVLNGLGLVAVRLVVLFLGGHPVVPPHDGHPAGP